MLHENVALVEILVEHWSGTLVLWKSLATTETHILSFELSVVFYMKNVLTGANALGIWVEHANLIIFSVGLATAQLRVSLLT